MKPFGDTMKPTALPALSNAAPYHLVTDSSVEELNAKIPSLKERVDALNFRFDSSVFNKVVTKLQPQLTVYSSWLSGFCI